MELPQNEEDRIWTEIESLRRRLNQLVVQKVNCLEDEEIITLSQELDRLIHAYIEKRKL